MGKVGSISLLKGLAANKVISTHAHNLVNVEGEFYVSRNKAIKETIELRLDHWKVISLVRDPIARNISAFVHKLSKKNYKAFPKYDPYVLHSLFVNKYDHHTPLRWFDEEFNLLFDNVYSRKFRHRGKYLKITNAEKNYEALVLRTEDLNWYHNVIRSFVDIPHITMPHSNSMAEKFWFYKEFVDFMRGKIPHSIVNALYSSKYTEHFYSKEEIREFVRYWTLI
jgi:hypothetical protein